MTAKAHGGPIEIFGTTVAQVDDKLRVQSLDTYMDSLDMFRQIAPYGVVNAEPMNHKVGLSDALDADAPNNDGIKIAEAHAKNGSDYSQKVSENADAKHISNSTGEPADAYVPHQGAAACPFMGSNIVNGAEAPHPIPSQTQNGDAASVGTSSGDTEFSDSVLVDRENMATEASTSASAQAQSDVATRQGAAIDLDAQPTPAVQSTSAISDVNAGAEISIEDSQPLPRSMYSCAVTGNMEDIIKTARSDNFVDESTATGTRDAVDEYLEKSAAEVHPQPKDMEDAVKPAAGEAVIAAAHSEETKKAKEEMSKVRKDEEPLIMNRE